MKVWVVRNESIIDTQEIIYMIWYYHTSSQVNMKDKQNFVVDYFKGSKYLGGGGGVQNTIFWPSGRVGISFGSINKSIITIQEIVDLILI